MNVHVCWTELVWLRIRIDKFKNVTVKLQRTYHVSHSYKFVQLFFFEIRMLKISFTLLLLLLCAICNVKMLHVNPHKLNSHEWIPNLLHIIHQNG